MPKILRTPQTRVFLIEDRAGPANAPEYQGCAAAQAANKPLGDITPVYCPSKTKYGGFDVVDETQGVAGLPTLGLQMRYSRDRSTMLRLANKGCALDLQIHMGACKDPSDFDAGWEKILVLENARMNSWGVDNLGALDGGGDASVLETTPFTGHALYEILPILPQEVAGALVTDEVIDVVICDSVQCGECGVSSDGCQVVFALIAANTGSPGLPAEIEYTQDGGATWASTHVTTLGLAETPSAMACVGSYLVVVSGDSGSLHYAPIADILDGTETWTEVDTGFVAPAGAPRAIVSLDRTHTWIVGDGGYVYFTDDITAGVTVQSAGTVTAQNLAAVAAYDEETLVAVGASNAFLLTQNGGTTWSLVTGPAAGVNLNCVAMPKQRVVWVGTNNGKLYYSTDQGASWTEKTFPGSGSGVTRDIAFANETVAYLAHSTTAPRGRLLRSISGGNSWYVIPETAGLSMPANDRITAVAACEEDPNVVFGGGLGDNGSDGFLFKAS